MSELTQDKIRATIREHGGIVHGDGNIFFTNLAMFLTVARELVGDLGYEQLRAVIDGGSESMTHEDALKQVEYWSAQ